MSGGYGTHTATCGRCGDSYSASGVMGDMKAETWRREHEQCHCRERSDEEKRAADELMALRVQSFFQMFNRDKATR